MDSHLVNPLGFPVLGRDSEQEQGGTAASPQVFPVHPAGRPLRRLGGKGHGGDLIGDGEAVFQNSRFKFRDKLPRLWKEGKQPGVLAELRLFLLFLAVNRHLIYPLGLPVLRRDGNAKQRVAPASAQAFPIHSAGRPLRRLGGKGHGHNFKGN